MDNQPSNQQQTQASGLPPLDSVSTQAPAQPQGQAQAQAQAQSAQIPGQSPPASQAPASDVATSQGSVPPTVGGDPFAELNNSNAAQPAAANEPNVYGAANLIEAAVKKGLINAEKAQDIKVAVTTKGKSIEESLQSEGVDEVTIYKTKAEMFGIEFADLENTEIPPAVLQKISQDVARKNTAVAVAETPRGIKVAMSDPLDIQKTKFIGAVIGGNIEPVFSTPSMINFVIDNRYSAQVGAEVEEALEEYDDNAVQLGSSVGEVTDLSASGGLANAPVSKIVNMVLEYAIRYQASDVHIEPRETQVSVRLRIFGVLNEKLTLPKKLHAAIVSRIKILSNLKIDEHRVPQDGRFQVKLGQDNVDLRVSIMPAAYGEKVVMRLLKKGGGAMDLEKTGMGGHAFEVFNHALEKTQGIVLVTGPTGSGKTQTLASALKVLNKPEVNIMTLEDPVEIRIDGINQVQINTEVGLTFARGLRAFLRQDPDIIMVGEIRDSETAGLAVQAALTGHLVLATLHTNSSAGAPPRLLDMEVEPFLLASTMNAVLGQRLVRTVCDNCKEAYYADTAVTKQAHEVMANVPGFNVYDLPNNQAPQEGDPSSGKIVLYRGKGCSKCNNTGYTGRVGIFEALEISEDVSKLILKRESASEILKVGKNNGMITMVQDGFSKALQGITTIEEVLRVQTG